MRLTKFAFAAGLVAIGATSALAQSLKGERGLVGIKLYDSGVRLVSVYGSPDDIQAVTLGGGAVGPANGGGGAGRGAGPGGPSAAGTASGGGGASQDAFDLTFGNDILRQAGKGGGPDGGGFAGAPGGQEGLSGDGGGGTRGGAASGANSIFTRWVYRRGGSRYGFVLDKFNRVVQIEAVGLSNPKVRTSTGLGFGTSFASIIKTYGAPDGYELNGDNLMVRYLVRNKVAFRLSRLGLDKPHVVTGIVVAAGKA